MYNYQIGAQYSFTVFPAALLGNNFQNCVVNGIIDAKTAQSYIDIYGDNAQFFPYLPAGTNSDPTKTNYIKITTSSGQVVILAATWIDESTISVITSQTITATIANIGPADVARIKNVLAANGYSSVVVTIQ